MGKLDLWIVPAGLMLLLVSCMSVQEPIAVTPVSESQSAGTGWPASPAADSSPAGKNGEQAEAVARMKEFLENGRRKVEQGVVSEGINQLVSLLAEGSALADPPAQARELMYAAETELAKIGAALELEAGSEWIDAEKRQVPASSLDVGTPKGLNPNVILTINLGSGKGLISGAPVTFEFAKGSGVLTAFVNTNDYGQANCVITRLDKPAEESIVRASVAYRAGGYTYLFKGLDKDFVYLPPSRKATILVFEKAKEPITGDPVILDAVYNRLKDVAFDFSHYNGILLGDAFLKVFGGDLKEIRRLGLEQGVSYLVMVFNDGYAVNQIEMGGKKYNIYKSQTTATTRIIRVADGKILYSAAVQGIAGQGGDERKAILDGFRAAAQAMSDKLGSEMTRIMEVLSGGVK